MSRFERLTGLSLWSLTNPPKLMVGLAVIFSGLAIGGQNLL